jgi:peptidyl-prolyl cis-trans isomerase C
MWLFLAIALSAAPALAASETPAAAPAGSAALSENVATVNGAPITRERFNRDVERAQQRFSAQGQQVPPEMEEMVKQRVLDFLVGEELLYQESVKKGIKVPDESIDAEMAKVKGQFGSDEKFTEALASMNATEMEVKKEISRGLAIQDLVEKEVVSKIEVTEAEERTFYDENPTYFAKGEQIKASHILIKVESGADEAAKAEAKAKIEKAAERVKNGEDFATVAKEVSEGPSQSRGGDLGTFQRGQMVKPFEDAAFALNPGEVSDIVETDFGFHIIKVFEKIPASTVPFEEAKPRIEQHLKQEKTKAALDAYVHQLKDGAKIETTL